MLEEMARLGAGLGGHAKEKIAWALCSWDNPDLGPASLIQLLDEPGVPENADLQRLARFATIIRSPMRQLLLALLLLRSTVWAASGKTTGVTKAGAVRDGSPSPK